MGAPISIAITHNLLPITLALYVRFIDGYQCWHPLSAKIFHDWKPMVRLALPSFVMLEACFLAWEMQVVISSYIGPVELAAQSALASIVSLGYQICISAAVAGSTRISNLVGAGLSRRARVAMYVSLSLGVFLGSSNLLLLFSLRSKIPHLFTSDAEVLAELTAMLPLCAGLQIWDAIVSSCNGILSAVGKQKIATYLLVTTSWVLVVPLGIVLAFPVNWKLLGIWIACVGGVAVSALGELFVVSQLDWEQAIEEAKERNKIE